MTDNDRAVITATEKPVTATPSQSGSFLPACFGTAGFLAAFLLFTIEPLAAKSLLPTLGGSAAVWNTAVAFFQITLLLGYLAAHLTTNWLRGRIRVWMQLGILIAPAALLPFDFPSSSPTGSPVKWELVALSVAVGAPFFALATFSPTLQRWFSWTDHPRAHDPFFLYAASNVGSFVGLLAYPFLVEPFLGLTAQSQLFRWLYFALVVLAAALLIKVRPGALEHALTAEPIAWKRRLLWITWSAIPSFGLLAVTRHIATDVASFPLLWVVPLALYLATFVLAFSKRSERYGRVAVRVFPLLAVIALTAAAGVLPQLLLAIGVPLLLLVASGLMAHGRLYSDRPSVSKLTEFYLWISVGGAVGGMLGAFVAPIVFNSIAEYPLALVASALLLTGRPEADRRRRAVLVALFAVLLAVAAIAQFNVNLVALTIGAAGAVAFLLAGRSAWFAPLLAVGLVVASSHGDDRVLARERTFYGVYRVLATEDGNHLMVSGTTIHGAQRFDPEPSTEPLAYYVEDGPFGQVMQTIGAQSQRVAVIGLGAGALASYLDASQHLTFFEIDPVVVDLAQNPDLFTLTRDSEGEVQFVTGDGRLTLAEQQHRFDLVIIDAFTSDVIPTHLLTREAVATYFDMLNEGGVVGLHISNRHFDLEPVLGRIAADYGLSARARHYTPTSSEGSPVSFVVLGRTAGDLAAIDELEGWRRPRIGHELWTDEFSNLLSVLR